MAPITVFVDSMMPVHKRMTDILPNKAVCDRLVASYLNTSETIYRILHAPTFFEQYELFWRASCSPSHFSPGCCRCCPSPPASRRSPRG